MQGDLGTREPEVAQRHVVDVGPLFHLRARPGQGDVPDEPGGHTEGAPFQPGHRDVDVSPLEQLIAHGRDHLLPQRLHLLPLRHVPAGLVVIPDQLPHDGCHYSHWTVP